jgi:hypothetical protein
MRTIFAFGTESMAVLALQICSIVRSIHEDMLSASSMLTLIDTIHISCEKIQQLVVGFCRQTLLEYVRVLRRSKAEIASLFWTD